MNKKNIQEYMDSIPKTFSKYLWHYCRQYQVYLFGLVMMTIFWALSVSLNPYAMKLIIDNMGRMDSHPENIWQVLWFPASFYVFLTFATSMVLRFYDWTMIKIFPKMKSVIALDMFKYLEQHSYHYFQQHFAGNLANKINDISKGAITIIHYIIDQLLSKTLALLIGLVAMYLVHPFFALVLFSWTVIFVTVAIFLSKKSQGYAENYAKSRSTVVGKIVDSISNILSVKLFARENYESLFLKKSLDEMVANDQRLQWFTMRIKIFYALSITVVTAIMTVLLVYERSLMNITVGDTVLILALTSVLIRDIYLLTGQMALFSEELGTCKQALSLVSTPYYIVDQPHSTDLKVTRGSIQFENVSFAYLKGQNLFIDKSVTINGGECVGLVGLSGAGKTTFVNLIMRFFDVDSGQILIDGQNIKNVTQKSLRNQVMMVPQDLQLFHRSLMENIRYGRVDATDEEVIECARKAHCHEFIEGLKEGYHTLVGERGLKLSGGQRQRIAIARAMLRNAPILILDEATGSLDSATESYIQSSLALLMKNRTSIIIAHRLSTLFHVDRILVFHNGKIIEDGTHEELIRRNGHYKMLWQIQGSGFVNDMQLVTSE